MRQEVWCLDDPPGPAEGKAVELASDGGAQLEVRERGRPGGEKLDRWFGEGDYRIVSRRRELLMVDLRPPRPPPRALLADREEAGLTPADQHRRGHAPG